MPIYEYRCANCNNQLEIMQKMSDEPLTKCPKCGENALKKQWSLSGFQFKGTGWYVSDYKASGKEETKSETKSENKTEGNSEGKSETKSETKSDGGESSKTEKTSGDKTSAGGESTAKPATASKPETKSTPKND